MISLILLALALASDAFAVALCQGAVIGQKPLRPSLAIGAAFGAAQAIAPLIGWGLGTLFAGVIESVDHWIAFVLLALVGGKMLLEGLKGGDKKETKRASRWALLALAVATSIDAAAAGFTLPTIGVGIWVSVTVIGLVTFVLSVAGVWIGRMGASALGSKAEILGGVVLIGLGVKVLVDHHAFGWPIFNLV
jgi:putative Mn2+ efflux pump MntP